MVPKPPRLQSKPGGVHPEQISGTSPNGRFRPVAAGRNDPKQTLMLYRFGLQRFSDQNTQPMSMAVMELRENKSSMSSLSCRSLSIGISGVATVLQSQLGQALFDVPSVLAD